MTTVSIWPKNSGFSRSGTKRGRLRRTSRWTTSSACHRLPPFADARDLRIGELTARLELATRQLAEAEKEKKELSSRLAARRKRAGTAGTDALDVLVDKALQLGDKKALKELSFWLASMGQPALTQPYTQRIVRRMEELRTPVPQTQHIYNAGSSHISDSQLSGINIGAPMPAGRSLPQE